MLKQADAAYAEDIARLGPWFHNLHLPDGTQTAPDHPLGDFPSYKWDQISGSLPEDLSGWTALDIGCNAGFYSLELARRGAQVTAMDLNDHYLAQARWAAVQCGQADRIRFTKGSVYDLARVSERYDLILFLGVLYHLRYPLLALDTLARLQPKQMILQTLSLDPADRGETDLSDVIFADRQRLSEPNWPRMAFIEHTFCKDPTNWWVPNHAAITGMLRSSGFEVTDNPGDEIYVCRMSETPPPCPWDESEWLSATGRGA